MRWVWLTSRHVRLSLRQPDVSLISSASSWPPNCADPLLHSTAPRHLATQGKPRTRLLPLGVLSHRPRLHLEEQAVVEHGKPPANPPEHLKANDKPKANKNEAAVQQGDNPELAKIDGLPTTPEHADSATPTKPAMSLKTAESGPFELAEVAGYQKTEQYPNVSDRTTIPEEQEFQPAGHTLAFSTYKPAEESLATSSSEFPGFSIDVHGQLRIKSTAAALRKNRTALIVSSVCRNMVEADFKRLLPRTPDHEKHQGGLLQAIPGRDADFNRLSYWILLFDTPYSAASFQYRLRWYHANTILNLPVNPYTAATKMNRELTPPEGYIDPLSGEDTWKRLHEFSVLLPTQSFKVTAMLEPFPVTISTDLRNSMLWKFPDGMLGTWPVRIWIDDYDLDASLVKRFVEEDGNERGRRWKLVTDITRIEPMVYTAFNNKGDRINRERNQISKEDLALLHASPHRNWVIRFRAEDDAILFWRTWHRRPFPESLSRSPGEERLLHVETLW